MQLKREILDYKRAKNMIYYTFKTWRIPYFGNWNNIYVENEKEKGK